MSQRSLAIAVDWTGKGSKIMGTKTKWEHTKYLWYAGRFFCWMTWNTSANLGTKALKIEDYFEQHWSPANSIEAVPHWPLVMARSLEIPTTSGPSLRYPSISQCINHRTERACNTQGCRLWIAKDIAGHCEYQDEGSQELTWKKAAKCWGKCMRTVAKSFLLQRFLPQRLEVEGTWENKSEKENKGIRLRDKLTLAQEFYILILL